jgi:hypothetical protein
MVADCGLVTVGFQLRLWVWLWEALVWVRQVDSCVGVRTSALSEASKIALC